MAINQGPSIKLRDSDPAVNTDFYMNRPLSDQEEFPLYPMWIAISANHLTFRDIYYGTRFEGMNIGVNTLSHGGEENIQAIYMSRITNGFHWSGEEAIAAYKFQSLEEFETYRDYILTNLPTVLIQALLK